MKKMIPDLRLSSIFEITPNFLAGRGIKLLLLDLDNTLVPYSGGVPTEEQRRWKNQLRAAGIELCIVSNTKKDHAKRFADIWGVPYVDRAHKPFDDSIETVIKRMKTTNEHTALVGDQIFTDVWGANRAGALSILVKPLVMKNPLHILRYAMETPFRSLCRNTGIS
jgi:uncharacterized protein